MKTYVAKLLAPLNVFKLNPCYILKNIYFSIALSLLELDYCF